VYAADWKILHQQARTLTLEEAKLGVKNNPGSFKEGYLLGLVYLGLYNTDAAYNTFLSLYNIDPKNDLAKWGFAEALRRRHYLNKSQALLREIITDQPEFSPAILSLGRLEYSSGNFASAAKLAATIIKKRPALVEINDYAAAYCLFAESKGLIAFHGGWIAKIINLIEAKSNLDKAQKLQPESAQVLSSLGSYYLFVPKFAGGDINKAESYLKKAVTLEPRFADGFVRLAQLYQIKNDRVKYNRYLRAALAIDPGNELALDIKSKECKFICVSNKK